MTNNDYKKMLCGDDLRSLDELETAVTGEVRKAIQNDTVIRDDINSLIAEVEELSALLGCPTEVLEPLPDIDIQFNTEIDQAIVEIGGKARAFPPMTTTEYIVSSLAGTLSVIIDVLLVGTPEVVKIYRGGERFDGSTLTELIRKIKPADGT